MRQFRSGATASSSNACPRSAHANFGCEHRTEPKLPVSNGFVACIATTLVQQFFSVPERYLELGILHYRNADDLGTCFELHEGAGLDHHQTPAAPLSGLKPSF